MGNECSACGQCQKSEKNNEIQINVNFQSFFKIIAYI